MKNSGITLVELLLVVSLIAIIGATVSPFLSNFVLRVNFQTTVDQVEGYLMKAQSYAMNNKNDETWGVCVTGNNLRLFSDSCASPSYAENYVIPGSVGIGNFSQVTFSSLRGEPNAAQAISITSDIESTSISLTAGGGITF
jgi:type II secretory pathway pseudopilin PulG